MDTLKQGLTFDDVLLVPGESDIKPNQTSFKTKLTSEIELNIPILSAAMDTVTTSSLAIALANEGGLGIIHKNMTIQEQAAEVKAVKMWESGIVSHPITLSPNQPVADALNIMRQQNISGFPVIDEGKLVGILTNRDLRGYTISDDTSVADLMTQELVTGTLETSLPEAKELMRQNRIEKLPLVDSDNKLCGLITLTDISKRENNPNACVDPDGHLRVGASVGIGPDSIERTNALVEAGVDVLVIDVAHGHNLDVAKRVKEIRSLHKDLAIVAGNIVTAAAVKALAEAGADVVKVGVGPGSICTTRIVAGVGVPQLTAVMDCATEGAKHGVTVIADGGIKYSGDIAKALAGGAACVMLGSLFAGTEEAPGERILAEGRSFKSYRGMGSIAAMKKGSSDRYFQADTDEKELIPEGIEGRIPYKGLLKDTVHQLVGGLGQAMFYVGCQTIPDMPKKTQFVQITSASLRESHPHDVKITKEAPNYRESM
ncbi:MAG: IMP dehydrogenase [Fibrobacterales bacterium]